MSESKLVWLIVESEEGSSGRGSVREKAIRIEIRVGIVDAVVCLRNSLYCLLYSSFVFTGY